MENITRRLRKGLEDTRRNESRGGGKVGQAGPTLGPISALFHPMPATLRKLPPPPLLMHLGPWLSRFDPTTHIDPIRQ